MNTLPNQWPRHFPPRPQHIDSLQVRHGYYFPVEPLQVLHMGGGPRQRQMEVMLDDDARFWSGEGRE